MSFSLSGLASLRVSGDDARYPGSRCSVLCVADRRVKNNCQDSSLNTTRLLTLTHAAQTTSLSAVRTSDGALAVQWTSRDAESASPGSLQFVCLADPICRNWLCVPCGQEGSGVFALRLWPSTLPCYVHMLSLWPDGGTSTSAVCVASAGVSAPVSAIGGNELGTESSLCRFEFGREQMELEVVDTPAIPLATIQRELPPLLHFVFAGNPAMPSFYFLFFSGFRFVLPFLTRALVCGGLALSIAVRQTLARFRQAKIEEDWANRHELTLEIDAVTSKRDALASKANALEAECTETREKIAEEEAECRALRAKADGLVESCAECRADVTITKHKCKVQAETIQRLETQLAELLAKFEAEHGKQPSLKDPDDFEPDDMVRSAHAEVPEVQDRMGVLRREAEPLEAIPQDVSTPRPWILAPSVGELRATLGRLHHECLALDCRLDALARERDGLLSRLDAVHREQAAAAERVTELEERLASLKTELADWTATYRANAARIRSLRHRIQVVAAQLDGKLLASSCVQPSLDQDAARHRTAEMEGLALRMETVALELDAVEREMIADRTEAVRFSVTAPTAVQRARVFRANVMMDAATKAAIDRLHRDMADAGRVVLAPLDGRPLEATLSRGTAIVAFLELQHCDVSPPSHRMVWVGHRDQASFFCSVPADCPDTLQGELHLVIEGEHELGTDPETGEAVTDTHLSMAFEISVATAEEAEAELAGLLTRWTSKLVARGFTRGVKGGRGHARWGVPEELASFTPLCRHPAIFALSHLAKSSEVALATALTSRALAGPIETEGADEIVAVSRALLSIDITLLQGFTLKLWGRELQSPEAIARMHRVAAAGVKLFEDCYTAVWTWIADTDADGVERYRTVLRTLKAAMEEHEAHQEAQSLQSAHDVAGLFADAVAAKADFASALVSVCRSVVGEAASPEDDSGNATSEGGGDQGSTHTTVRSHARESQDISLGATVCGTANCDAPAAADSPFCCRECQAGRGFHDPSCTQASTWSSREVHRFGDGRVTLTLAPIKRTDRVVEKVAVRMMEQNAARLAKSPPDRVTPIEPSARHVNDVGRAMVELRSMQDVAAVCAAVLASDTLAVVRVKDRFLGEPEFQERPIRGFVSRLTQGGWRDVMLNVVLKGRSDHVLEVQVCQAAAYLPPPISRDNPSQGARCVA